MEDKWNIGDDVLDQWRNKDKAQQDSDRNKTRQIEQQKREQIHREQQVKKEQGQPKRNK